MVLGMDADTEEDQMMRAIAMSLGENVLMSVDGEVCIHLVLILAPFLSFVVTLGGVPRRKLRKKTYLNFILMARINYNLDPIY